VAFLNNMQEHERTRVCESINMEFSKHLFIQCTECCGQVAGILREYSEGREFKSWPVIPAVVFLGLLRLFTYISGWYFPIDTIVSFN
jgi:hypothetical protein